MLFSYDVAEAFISEALSAQLSEHSPSDLFWFMKHDF